MMEGGTDDGGKEGRGREEGGREGRREGGWEGRRDEKREGKEGMAGGTERGRGCEVHVK